jgi:hypothetical protein
MQDASGSRIDYSDIIRHSALITTSIRGKRLSDHRSGPVWGSRGDRTGGSKMASLASRCVTALWRLGLRRAGLREMASHGVTLRHSLMALGVMARAPRHDDHFLVLGGEMASVRSVIFAVRLAALASSARRLASVRSVIFAVRLAALASSPAVDLGHGGRATRPPGLEPHHIDYGRCPAVRGGKSQEVRFGSCGNAGLSRLWWSCRFRRTGGARSQGWVNDPTFPETRVWAQTEW